MTNVWYVKNILANCDGNLYFPISHLPRVELHCKLQEILRRVTLPLVKILMSSEHAFKPRSSIFMLLSYC